MITVPEVVEEIVRRSPFLEEGLAGGIINLSSLARQIQPEIQEKLYKDIKPGAIIMALKRLALKLDKNKTNLSSIFSKLSDLTVRSNIVYYTFENSPNINIKQEQLLKVAAGEKGTFLTLSQGVFETAIFASNNLTKEIESIFVGEKLRFKLSGLSSITIILPKEAVEVPGVYYTILKNLAWEGINFVEVISSYTELTIFMDNSNINRAFAALKKLSS